MRKIFPILLVTSLLILTGCLGRNNEIEIDPDNIVHRHTYKIYSDDPDTFEGITGDYSKDSLNAYYRINRINGADPDTFELIVYDYRKDKDQVYYKNKIIPGADSNTFGRKDYEMADKNYLYFKGTANRGIDITSIENLDGQRIKDAKAMYFYGQKVEGLDIHNYRFLDRNYIVDTENVWIASLHLPAYLMQITGADARWW